MNTPKVLQKFWALSLVILLAGFIGIGQASAQWFVDGVAGNDTFNGSQMAVGGFPNGPFKTIAAATAVAVDGETVTILAHNYAEAVSTTAAVTYEVQTSGGNTVVTIQSITHNSAGDTVTYTDAAGGGVGTFSLTAGITLTAGTVNFGTAVVVATGQTITRTNGFLTGTAPTVTNVNVTYGATTAASITAGNELAANIGTGTLTFGGASGDTVVVPNALSAATIAKSGAGNATFSSAVTTTGANATDINVTAAGTLTFAGLTVAGGITIGANAAVVNAGAVSVGAHPVAHGGTGLVTFASLALGTEELTVTGAGGATVTGAVTFSNGARDVITNSSTGTLTIGTVTSQITDTAGDDSGADMDIVNSSTGKITITGAITEGFLSPDAQDAAGTFEYATISIENTNAGGAFTIGASSTISGDVNNADRTGSGAATGIILTNSATLTVRAIDSADGTDSPANRTSFGDVTGGTLVLAYANAAPDAIATAAGNARSVTLVNNLTFATAATAGVTGASDNDQAVDILATQTVGGDLRLQAPSVTYEVQFTVTGTVYIEANSIKIDAVSDDTSDNIVKNGTAQGNWGGLNVGSSTGFTVGTNSADAGDDVTVTGTTAIPGPSVFGGDFNAATAAVTTLNGFESDAFAAASHTASTGTTTVGDANGAYDVAGAVVVSAGATLAIASAAATDDAGSLDINGTLNYSSTGTLTVSGNVDIDATTGTLATAGAANFTFGGNFTGGTYTDTGTNDDIIFNTPSGGSTIAVKPGTSVNTLTFNGVGRTATVTESITADAGITLGNNTVVALGANSFILTGGDLTLNDEAAITNSGTNGSVQFTATGSVTQNIVVASTPTVNPTLQNVVLNMSDASGTLNISQAININGTTTLLDGALTGAGLITFTGANGKIAIDKANVGVTGTVLGVHDLEYLGTATTGGNEYTATNIRNLTINMTSGNQLTLPVRIATITGNLVINAGSTLETAAKLTVTGNATFNGNFIGAAGDELEVSGVLTVADGITVDDASGGTTVQLLGNNQTHSIVGMFATGATLKVTGTGITVNGSIAAGDANNDSELDIVVVDAAASVTFNTIQDVNGAVTVNGTAVMTLVSDGGNTSDTDGQVTGNVDVNAGGSLTLASNDATVTALGGTLTVDDNSSFILGSNLGITGDVTVGNGANATAATFNLAGFTFIAGGAAGAITVNASAAPATAPSFGTTGTLNLPNSSVIVGATNPTIKNLTINGGAAIDSDVTVTGTFTVSAASSGADSKDVTVTGAAQVNANYTGTAGSAGSRLIMAGTASTLSTSASTLTITNLGVASSTSTTLAKSTTGTTEFTVNYLDHDSGLLDITDEGLTLVGNSGSADDWDHDGGTYAGTGIYTMTGAGSTEIDLSTNGATISVPNLTVNGGAGQGIQLDAAGDGLTVTGTLTLNGTAPNVQTEVGTTDATFTMGNGSTIVRSTSGAGDHFDNAPTLGTGMTVRYTNSAADVTTANELPTTLLRLEYEGGAANNLILEDGVAVTVDQLESSGDINIDANGDDDNTITITDGGRIEYDGANADFTFDTPVVAGAITYRWDVTDTTTDLLWPDAQTGATVSVTDGTVTLHESRTAGVLVIGDGTGLAGSAELALGANTMTVSGATSIDSDGSVTGAGTLNADGIVTNSGTLSTVVVASKDLTLTGNIASLTLDGTTAQTVTVPAAGASFATALVVNNAAGATFAGMTSGSAVRVGAQVLNSASSAVATVTAGLTLTNGVLTIPDGNSLILPHGGSGLQGYSRTNGCVFGNIRKQLSNTTSTAPADRMDFPLCSQGGLYRPYAVTFNNPNTIGGVAPTAAPATTDASPAITVRHDVSGENSVAELSGTNGLAQTVNGVSIARYPQAPSFFWTVSPSFTMSPSLSYDVDMRANDYANFSSSCGASACDINEIYPVRRHVGSTSNLWSVASSTTDNFLAGANDPVVIGRSATGALQSSGTVFTYGLKSIFAAAASPAAIAVSTGLGHVVDLSSLFSGYTGALTYTVVSSDNTGAASPTLANVAGNNLTVIGGATVGAATVTVTATDSFSGTASVSFVANNSAALTATATDLDRTLNVGNLSSALFADAFTGGAGVVAYGVVSSSAAVTAVGNATGVALTAVSAGAATITITATDASSTPNVVVKTFTVTVNTGVGVAAAVADMSVVQGATATVNTAAVFSNGTGAIAVTVSGGNTTASATEAAGVVTITGLKAYAGSPLADTTPVTVTLTGTDTLGGVSTDDFTVTVTPVKGDLDGSGAPTAASASLALDASLGLLVLTANQAVAVDYNNDTFVTAYDAALIFAAALASKDEIVANVSSRIEFGSLEYVNGVINVPVQLVGDLNNVVSAELSTFINPAMATIVGITSNLQDGWMVRHVIGEDGKVRLAIAGIGDMTADGTIATIAIKLNDVNAVFSLTGDGAVNNNTISSIDAIEVAELPDTFTLQGNYPNPFNPSTTIQFDLPETADVEIQVFDMVGRVVMNLPAQNIKAGSKRSVQVNASQLASGSYFYRVIARMESKTLVETGRMMLVK